MKIIFFCGDRSRYGLAHLAPILSSSFEVAAIVFGTEERWRIFRDALAGKTHHVIPDTSTSTGIRGLIKRSRQRLGAYRLRARTRKLIQNNGVPLWHVFNVGDEAFLEKVRNVAPDLIISAAYPQIFPKTLLDIPKVHAVNFHPSLLPKYRGAHPHFWTIVHGETESGVTAHLMTEKLDDGDIVAQRAFDIKDFTYNQLYDRIVQETPVLVQDVDRFFTRNTGTAIPQDKNSATFFRNDRDIHRRIFWSHHSAGQIVNLSRTGIAFFFFQGHRVFPTKAVAYAENRNMTNQVVVPSGTLVDLAPDGLVVKVQDGFVHLQTIVDRGRPYDAIAWAQKHRIQTGEVFT